MTQSQWKLSFAGALLAAGTLFAATSEPARALVSLREGTLAVRFDGETAHQVYEALDLPVEICRGGACKRLVVDKGTLVVTALEHTTFVAVKLH